MSIAWFRPAASPPITSAGSTLAIASSSPERCCAIVFRGKFVDALKRAFADGQLGFYGDFKLLAEAKAFAAFLRPLFRRDWVVYCKPPFGGPEYVLRYLGRYTHRVAISNHRLVALAGQPSHLSLERLRAR